MDRGVFHVCVQNMTGSTSRMWRTLGVVSRLYFVALGVVLPIGLGAGWVHLLAFPLVAASASPLFCVLAFLIHLVVFQFPALFVFPVSCLDAGVAVLALVLARVGRLGMNDRTPQLVQTLMHGLVRPLFLWTYPVLLCWTLLRGASAIQGMSLLCVTVLVHRANPLLHTAVGGAVRGLAVNVTVLIVSLVFAAALLEGGARTLFGAPKGSSALWIPDKEYHFLLNPAVVVTQKVFVSKNTKKTFAYHISSQGFRDREYPGKSPGETRILLLGDSFTMGHAVDSEDTIANRLATFCRPHGPGPVTVVNGGMNGAGPLQELGMLKRRGLALEPDCVILQLFLFNDFDDCLMTVGKAQRSFFEKFHRIAGNLHKANAFPGRQEFLLRIHSSAYYLLECATDFRPWASRFLCQWRFAPEATPPDIILHSDYPEWSPILDSNRVDWYPELEEGADLLVDYVGRMRELCLRNNLHFAVYCIPDYHEITADSWAAFAKSLHGEFESERHRAIKIVEKRLAEKGIATFSVTDALEKEAASHGVERLYYVLDGHLTPRGNEVVAGRVHEFLAAVGCCD